MGCKTLWISLSLLLQMTSRYVAEVPNGLSKPFAIVLNGPISNCATDQV